MVARRSEIGMTGPALSGDDREGEDDVAGGGDVGDGLEDEFGEAEGVGAELGMGCGV